MHASWFPALAELPTYASPRFLLARKTCDCAPRCTMIKRKAVRCIVTHPAMQMKAFVIPFIVTVADHLMGDSRVGSELALLRKFRSAGAGKTRLYLQIGCDYVKKMPYCSNNANRWNRLPKAEIDRLLKIQFKRLDLQCLNSTGIKHRAENGRMLEFWNKMKEN